MQRNLKAYTAPKLADNGSILRMTSSNGPAVPQDRDLIHQFDEEGSVGFLL